MAACKLRWAHYDDAPTHHRSHFTVRLPLLALIGALLVEGEMAELTCLYRYCRVT